MPATTGLVMDDHHGRTRGPTNALDAIHCGARNNILAQAAADASEQAIYDDQHKAIGVMREKIINRCRIVQVKPIVSQYQLPIERILGQTKMLQDFHKPLLYLLT